jgi:SpoU rRNA methylase family enzyme
MVLKLKDALEVLPFIQNLVEEQSIGVDELTSFASNIIMEVCVVLKSFLSFLRKLEKKKALICFL